MLAGSSIPLVSLVSSDGVSLVTVTTSGAMLVTGPASGAGSTAVNVVGSTGQQAVVTSSGALSISGSLSVSGTTGVNLIGSTGQQAVVTSSGALLISGPTGAGSTSVSLSSSPLVLVASSGGTQLVQSTAATNPWSSAPSFTLAVASTVATNPWSSAPGFNVPMVSASSGLVQLSGIPSVVVATSAGLTQTVTVLSASSGLVQISGTPLVLIATSGATHLVQSTQATNPWSSAPGFNMPVLSVSSGLIALTSAPLVIVASSGGTLIVALSSAPTVTATAGTNPWSSAPGFNLPVVSVSSGLVQVSGTVTVLNASSGLVQALQSTAPWLVDITSTGTAGGSRCQFFTQTSGGSTAPQGVASTSPVRLYSIWGYSSTPNSQILQVYNVSSSNATIGTTNPIISVPLLLYTSSNSASPYILFESPRGVSCTGGLSFAVTITATGATVGSGRITLEYST